MDQKSRTLSRRQFIGDAAAVSAYLSYAVQARKHIFAEKCVAVDPVGIRSVMASGRMAESAGLNVVIGTQRRHSPDYHKCFEMVKNGAIGDLLSANCYWNQGMFRHVYPQPGWSDMEAMIRDFFNWCWLNGDHILDQHVHNIDIIAWFLRKHLSKLLEWEEGITDLLAISMISLVLILNLMMDVISMACADKLKVVPIMCLN
jgi:hypothetical protein